ncbi:MAG: leucine--tRNA ligase [Candidatus Omnitrophica bacterium]|nr:leucine--tRNA ligase [Candidatus Omnitrophota bacterium]
MEEIYPFRTIEPKWQSFWEKERLFEVDTSRTDKTKYYCLVMFPYPSATLHVGHGRNYIIGDVVARYKLMRGFNVLAPIGWDAFGLPAENAAIKGGLHPKISTLNNIATMKRQLRQWGVCYDWRREVTACFPDYYKWSQWIFLKLYEKSLAYKKRAAVNWCSSCQTVLANEQVVNGACERCETPVIQKFLEQWFFKITDYAERLLKDIAQLTHWPERVRVMQRNWIGKNEGVAIHFPVDGEGEPLTCFTTRVDTIYGATYMVLAPEHPRLQELIRDSKNKGEIQQFVERILRQPQEERSALEVKKEGVFTGWHVVNPVNGRKIPLWVANYVLLEYGTGAVMAVPAHDQRDFEFAKKYGLPIEVVIDQPENPLNPLTMKEAYIEEGIMVHSELFNGLGNREAMEKIAHFMEKKGMGRRTSAYRLRDWLISRQRYWGAPIPILYCNACGIVPVPEKDLPVLLPENVRFRPTGESPLKDAPEFVKTRCPKCKGEGKREFDTMDTFVDSSWYFLRYLSPQNAERPFDTALVNRWLPVDQYIGGVEHAILHLLYSRFIVKVLHDLGYVGFDEPFERLFTQGMIIKDGFKMSKSKGNVVSPDELIERFGADTVRLYTLFIGPPEKDAEWSDRGVEGAFRFLNRVWRLSQLLSKRGALVPVSSAVSGLNEEGVSLRRKLHLTLKKVTEDMEGSFRFNTAIASMMELVNEIYRYLGEEEKTLQENERVLLREAFELLVLLLAPFIPHLAEEIWSSLGRKGSVFRASWPSYDPNAIAVEEVTIVIQVNGKVRSKLNVAVDLSDELLKEKILNDESIRKWLDGKTVKQWVIVPKKLVNLVVT